MSWFASQEEVDDFIAQYQEATERSRRMTSQWLVLYGVDKTGFFWDYEAAKSFAEEKAGEGQLSSIYKFSEAVKKSPTERDFFEEGVVQGEQKAINDCYGSWKDLNDRVKVLEKWRERLSL